MIPYCTSFLKLRNLGVGWNIAWLNTFVAVLNNLADKLIGYNRVHFPPIEHVSTGQVDLLLLVVSEQHHCLNSSFKLRHEELRVCSETLQAFLLQKSLECCQSCTINLVRDFFLVSGVFFNASRL